MTLAATDRKAWATFQAGLALRGYSAFLTRGANGATEVTVSRWGKLRSFDGLTAASAWACQVGLIKPVAQECGPTEGGRHDGVDT